MIEFDLKISDYNRLLVVCKNLLESKEFKQKEFECDIFNESECHHTHDHDDNFFKCTYCKFYDLLEERAHTLKINSDLYKTTSNVPHFVQMRFKKTKYPLGNILEWCEFQPWRSPYGFVAYASCSTQADVLEAVKNYEHEKEKLKKSLISSKLFIDMHIKHEMSEEYRNTLAAASSSNSLSMNILFLNIS